MKNIIRYTVGTCNVEIPFAKTQVSQRPVFAPNGYTVEGTEYSVNVSGYATAGTVDDFRLLIYKMRNILGKPRGKLEVLWGDATADLEFYTFDADGDTQYGPKVDGPYIDEFSGGLAASYSWKLTTVRKECFENCTTASATSPTKAILSLTRQSSIDVDQNFMVSRAVSGELRVRGSFVAAGRSVDELRGDTDPKVPNGFRRMSAKFSTSPDGLVLRYEYLDKEVHYTLPEPITQGRASYSISVAGMGGMSSHSLTGSFEAPRDISKDAIVAKIYLLLASKVRPSENPGGPDGLGFIAWSERRLTEEVYDNTVTFSFAWSQTAIAGGENDNVYDTGGFGITPPGSNGVATEGSLYGGRQKEQGGHSKVFSPVPSFFDACNNGTTVSVNPSNSAIPHTIGRPTEIENTSFYDKTPSTPPSKESLTDDKRESSGNEEESQDMSPTKAHKDAPFIAHHERYSWEVDNKLIRFAPASQSGDPIIQKSAATSVTLIQAGYTVRRGRRDFVPKAPKPRYGPDLAEMATSSFETQNLLPTGFAGDFQMITRWSYVMLLKKNPGTSADFLKTIVTPTDPRIKATEKTNTPIDFGTDTSGYGIIVRRDASS